MRVLIIYESNPSGVTLYDVHMTPEQWDIVKEADNKFINSDDTNDGMNFLNEALCPKRDWLEHPDVEHGCMWADCKLKSAYTSNTFDKILYTGFME